MLWDKAKIATLKGMWNAGVPVRDIAAELKTTKNSAIGKAHRLKLEMHVDANPRRSALAIESRNVRPRRPARWRDELEQKLKLLWAAGVPQREIGKQLGFSNPAISKKAWRLGLPSRSIAKLRIDTPWRRPGKPKLPQKIVVNIVDSEIPLGQRKTLLELGPNDCRFPIGDPTKGFWCNEEFYFCGGSTDGGQYCPGHTARATYNPCASAASISQRSLSEHQARQSQDAGIHRLADIGRVLPDATERMEVAEGDRAIRA